MRPCSHWHAGQGAAQDKYLVRHDGVLGWAAIWGIIICFVQCCMQPARADQALEFEFLKEKKGSGGGSSSYNTARNAAAVRGAAINI